MPDTISYEEATAPQKLSYDEAVAPQRQEKKKELESELETERTRGNRLGALTKGIDYATDVAQFASHPGNVLNIPSRLALQGDVLEPDKPLIPIPKPTGTNAMAGLGRLGANFLEGLETPDMAMSYPGFASPVVRGLTAAQMLTHVPEGVQKAIQTFNDPNATPADKVEAVGNPAIATAMATLISRHGLGEKPSGVLPTEETAGKISPPIELPTPEAEPAAPTVKESLTVQPSPQTPEAPNATNPQTEQASVPVERQGTDEGRPSAEKRGGDSLLSPATAEETVKPTESPAQEVAKEASVPLTPDQIYDKSLEDFRSASKEFTKAQKAYRAKTISDEEFLAAKVKFKRAEELADQSEVDFIAAKNKPSPPPIVDQTVNKAEEPAPASKPVSPVVDQTSQKPAVESKEPWNMTEDERKKEGWIGPVLRGTHSGKKGAAEFFTDDPEYAKMYSSVGGYKGSYLKHEPENVSYDPTSTVEQWYVKNPKITQEEKPWGMKGKATVYNSKEAIKVPPTKPAEPAPVAAPSRVKIGKSPQTYTVVERPAAKEFDDLVIEHAERAGWSRCPEDLYNPVTDKSGHSTMSIQGKIKYSKAIKAAREQVARDLGLDPERIGNPTYRAAALEKLKQHIAENLSGEADDTGVYPEGASTEFLPEEETPAPKAPKLAPGVKQGDLISSTQKEDFALVGEKGTDLERIAAAKAKAAKDAAEAKAIQEKQQQGLTGMGGAVPSEFENSNQTATGIKNATVDLERARRGVPPAIQPLRREFGEVWDRAMARIDQDPEWQDNLIDQLRDHPRALTDEEDAALLHRQVDLQNDYGKATRNLAQAYADGNNPMLEEMRGRVATLRDQLYDIYTIGKRVGTETGRGLAARKMMANEDFSLAPMELALRGAKGGAPLSEAELSKIQQLHDEVKATQKAHDDYVEATTAKMAQMEIDRLAAEAKAAQSAKPQFHPKVMEAAKRIVGVLDSKADAARARIKERLSRTSAGVDPTVLLDLAEIGASHLGHAVLDFGEWSAKMVGEFGDLVKPHLQAVFDKSQEILNKATTNNLEAARAMREKTPEDQIKANAEKIGEKVKTGKKGDIVWYVQRIARLLVQSGLSDREKLVDTIHSILQEHLPDITRRQTMDAISGYGDFKQLSKDAISIQLRGIKGELQQLAKLEDMTKGKPPLKSGVERRDPTEAERQLIKKVNEAKFAFQVPMTDPATQLKSALDTYKTALKNRTADLEDRIARRDFSRTPRRELLLDRKAMELKAENERVKQKWQQLLRQEELKNRTTFKKIADTFVKWSRGFLLSGVSTLGKLTGAAFWRMSANPTEQMAGSALRRLPGVSQIAERAPIEGAGFNVKTEAKALAAAFTRGIDDAKKTAKTGKSDLDMLLGGKENVGSGEVDEGASIVDLFGHLHGALKAPVKRASFKRAMENQTAFYLKHGVDTTDPLVQTKMMVEAYKRANRDIFMQPNWFSDRFRRAVNSLEEKDKLTQKTPVGGTLTATALKTLAPIVKVPSNIVGEALQYASGLVSGGYKVAKALKAGADTLKPQEADIIMRELKKGLVGNAVLALGYFAPQMFGGYYQQGEKRKPGEPKYGAAKVGATQIPKEILHFPLIEAAQLGATVRRVADSKLRKKDKNTQGLTEGAIAGALGLVEETPFINDMTQVTRGFNRYERAQWVGELAKSRLVPQMLSQAAEYFDKDAKGNPIKRKTEGTIAQQVVQGVESGIPGLREKLPVKKTR